MVRGSALRVTGLARCGSIPETIQYATSKSVSRVAINEVTEAGANEALKTEQDETRLLLVRPEQTIRYKVDIDFLRVDPGMLSLVTGMSLVYGHPSESGFGFGEGGFGVVPFGGSGGLGDVVGFDAKTRMPAAAFALEVWSRLTGQACVDGERKYGYTLFPYLRGGYLSGFQFTNGLVSFRLVGAQARRGSKWGYGPYDLEGEWERLNSPIERKTQWRTFITTAAPPTEQDGIIEFTDGIDGGDADETTSDIIDNYYAPEASQTPDLIEGGSAA